MNILLRLAILINLIGMIMSYKNNIYGILVAGFCGVILAITLTMYKDDSL